MTTYPEGLTRLSPLAQFFDWAIRTAWDGAGLDGGEIQDKALELGLIERVPYDPDAHGPRGAHDFGLKRGEDWYVKARAEVK